MRKFIFAALAVALASTALPQVTHNLMVKRSNAMHQLRQLQPEVQFLITGDKIDRVYGAPFGGGTSYESAAKTFIANYSDLFDIDQGTFKFDRLQSIMDGRFTAAYFNEYIDGVPVDNGYATVLMRSDLGLPIVLASGIGQAVKGPLPTAKIQPKRAAQIALASDTDLNRTDQPKLVVWMGEASQHLAWKLLAQGDKNTDCAVGCALPPYKAITIWIDAVTGKILNKRSEVYDVDVTGSVKGWGQPGQNPDWPTNPETLQPLPNLRVDISGGGFAYTDANGNYTISNPGVTPVTVTSAVSGRWCTVATAQGTLLTSSTSVTPPGPNNIVYAGDLAQFNVAQVNAYIQVNRVHDFVKAQNASYPGVDISLTTNVNQASSCNANFNSGNMTINFFNQAGGCVNTAYSSVVHHEYGHFAVNRGGTAQGGYGEGMGDVFSALLADDPRLGLEFQGQGTGPIRHCINTAHYPENAGSEVHLAGQIVSGAFWETVVKMDTTIGHAAGLALMRNYAVNSILLHPPGITPGLTVDVLTLDDNDANLNNGTPNYDDIAFGFGKKGLTAPPVTYFNFLPIAIPGELTLYDHNNEVIIPFRIQVVANVTEPDPSTVRLYYRLNGGAWQNTPMNEIADPGFMFGGIDQPTNGTVVDFYFQASDTQNHTLTYPAAGAAGPLSTIVADGLQTIFADTFEAALGWTVSNDVSLTSGAWVRADPNGTTNGGAQANPENDSDDPGAQCMFTGQGTVGGAVGSADVDGGPTDLISPTFDLSGGDAIIDYRRWFYSANGTIDTYTISISNNNGASWVTVETLTGATNNNWGKKSFRVSQFVAPTSQVKVRFRATDNPNDSVTEAGVDNFNVRKIVIN